MLTPRDIHEKNFTEVKKGYSRDEVDDFLDEIIVDYDKLTRENKELLGRIEALNSQIESYRGMENSLMHTMVTAHKAADDITDKAKRESEDMVNHAQQEASNIISSAEMRARAKMENYEKEMVAVENRIMAMKNVVSEFKSSVMDFSQELVTVIEGLSTPDFAGHDDAEMDGIQAE